MGDDAVPAAAAGAGGVVIPGGLVRELLQIDVHLRQRCLGVHGVTLHRMLRRGQ